MSQHLLPLPPTLQCAYCGETFTPAEQHRAERLLYRMNPNGAPLSFCCRDHRKARLDLHVAFEDKHVEIPGDDERGALSDRGSGADAIRYSGEPAPEIPMAGLPDSVKEKLTAFFCNWMRMSPAARDAAVATMLGIPHAELARRSGVSSQATHKAFLMARAKCPAVASITQAPKPMRRRVAVGAVGPSGDSGSPSSDGPHACIPLDLVPHGEAADG
jgi:hypothetical protein